VELDIDQATVSAVVTMAEGQELAFALAQESAWNPPPTACSDRVVRRGLGATEKAWRSWSELHQRYEGPYRDLVHRCDGLRSDDELA
jgi:alpha,alpha-trehalase